MRKYRVILRFKQPTVFVTEVDIDDERHERPEVEAVKAAVDFALNESEPDDWVAEGTPPCTCKLKSVMVEEVVDDEGEE